MGRLIFKRYVYIKPKQGQFQIDSNNNNVQKNHELLHHALNTTTTQQANKTYWWNILCLISPQNEEYTSK